MSCVAWAWVREMVWDTWMVWGKGGVGQGDVGQGCDVGLARVRDRKMVWDREKLDREVV